MNEISTRKPHSVRIGSSVYYCDEFSFTKRGEYITKVGADGSAVLGNSGLDRTDILIKCRTYTKDRPIRQCAQVIGNVGILKVNIRYRDVEFRDCIITECTLNDSGEEHIFLTVKAATMGTAYMMQEDAD